MGKWIFRIAIVLVLVAAFIILKMTVFAPKPVPVRVVSASIRFPAA